MKNIIILITAIILGLTIVVLKHSINNANEYLNEEVNETIFQELIILKEKNQNLENEIKDLEDLSAQLANQNSALEAIENEIIKFKKLSGKFPIFGSGLTLIVDSKLTTPWIIDIINEFYNNKAEAISINGIRITNDTTGFYSMPQGQILINEKILSPPFEFNIIGDTKTLVEAFNSSNNTFDKLKSTFGEENISFKEKEIIQMD